MTQDVTWFEAHLLIDDDRNVQIGIVAKARDSDETVETVRFPVDNDALQKFLGRFPNANNIAIPPREKPWPGDVSPTTGVQGFDRNEFIRISEAEAGRDISWRGNGKAKKYTRKFEPVFGTGRFSWCAAFVTWCCEQAGLRLPIHVPGDRSGYTFALCEAWQQWAIREGLWRNPRDGYEPAAGDIVIFDWDGATDPDNDWEDHIGVFLEMDGSRLVCAEGNVRDVTAIKLRDVRFVQGFVVIPQGYRMGSQPGDMI